MKTSRPSPRRPAGALRDLVLISLATAILIWLGASTHALDGIHRFLRHLLPGHKDELVIGWMLAAVGLAVFAVLRTADASRQTRARTVAEGRYRAFLERMPAVTYALDPRKPVGTAPPSYVSPQVESVLGFTAEQWRADPGIRIRQIHPYDRDNVVAASAAARRTGQPFSIEYRHVRPDGEVIWIREDGVVVERDARRRSSLVQGVMYDITERKRAEESLAEAEARYRTLVERVPAVTYIWDTKFETGEAPAPYISPQIEHLLGYSQKDFQDPMLWTRLVHAEDRDRVLAEWHESIAGDGTPFRSEYRMRALDGRIVWIRDEAIPIGHSFEGNAIFQGVMFDITERKYAEEMLRQAEQRFRTLVENLPAVTYVDAVDPRSTTIYVSPQVETLFGYTPEAWRADPDLWIRALHPSDVDRVVAAVEAHNRHGDPYDVEYRLRAADGAWRWVSDRAKVVRDDSGQILFSQGVMFDITERRASDEQLRETEAKYRALVEHIPAVLYIDPADEPRTSLYVSPQAEDVLGISRERYLSDPDYWLEIVHPEDRTLVERTYHDTLGSRAGWAVEYRIQRPNDGRTIWLRDESAFLTGGEGGPDLIQGVIFDVTERKLAEEALHESERREREAAERLRALDEMKNTFLAAVSHELRSPLTSILGLSLTLETTELPADDRRDLLTRLAANARKLDRLLRDLLDIDRLNRGIVTPNYRPTDVGALARRTVESLDLFGDRRITVEAESVVLPVDPAKLERIVENLVANAVRHTSPETNIWIRIGRQDGGVLIAVEDDGPGVPKDIQKEIFEPFRQGPTASPHSPGTGIGLSLVRAFAELHGGRAWVQDREGGGASFRVLLPGTPVPTAFSAAQGDVVLETDEPSDLDRATAG